MPETGICTVCNDDFYKNPSDDSCVACNLGCVRCSIGGQCLGIECKTGYEHDAVTGNCVSICITENCKICSDDINICTECLEGYYPSGEGNSLQVQPYFLEITKKKKN